MGSVVSLPAWGVWIEILSQVSLVMSLQVSLPAWGVWIEISTINAMITAVRVTPRMGSVD